MTKPVCLLARVLSFSLSLSLSLCIFLLVWRQPLTFVRTIHYGPFSPAVVDKGRYFCTPLAINSTVAGYVGFALFLLLGFRVSEAYGRYMQGVALWNDSISGGVGTVRIHKTTIPSTNNPVPHPAVTKSQMPNELKQIFSILIVKPARVLYA
jgi:hypothetical protein